jgi:hypothetical protein
MVPAKPSKTLADYLVIAISPALIILLVHSVCFFLVDIFYRGEAAGGVRWVLFWFVLAVVLIARIGIEQGDGHAMAYGLCLAGAAWAYLFVVQSNPVFGALLLAIVWFTAHKITSNCTLVDDEADASGQGLLPSLRQLPRLLRQRLPSLAKKETTAPRPATPPAPAAKKTKSPAAPPGLWLIYFSLAALPIFGLGQMLLPAGDFAARHRGFVYLFLYLTAALGLLITTSFLGLRRYLRQRYLVMPGNIAFGWIQFGVIGAALVLCLSLLLPRPGAGEAWGALRYHVDYQIRRASAYAARFNPHGSGAGRAGDQSAPNAPPGSQPSPDGQPSDQTGKSGAGQPGSQQPGDASGQNSSSGSQPNPSPGVSLSPAAGAIYPWLKLLFYLAALVGLAWMFYHYRVAILAAIRQCIAALRALFRPAARALPAATRAPAVPAFKTFKNPFLTGADRVWPPEQLVTCTYDALQSWASNEKSPPGSPQTPREFCRQLAREIPDAAPALEHLAFLYGHVAYSASLPANFDRDHLRLLWEYMSLPRPKAGTVQLNELLTTDEDRSGNTSGFT